MSHRGSAITMNVARRAIEKPLNTWLIVVVCIFGGLWALQTLGRLEQPETTIKEVLIATPYPGASAIEVEQEVTDGLEEAIQRLPQVKEVRSRSTAGMSMIIAETHQEYGTKELPQVWDEVRRRVSDVQSSLPPGAGPSQVKDDYNDVFGLYYAITGPDYSLADLERYAQAIRKDVLQVDGVAKVVVNGKRQERIYVEFAQSVLSQLGISPSQIINTLQVQNAIVDAGQIRIDDQSLRVVPSGEFSTVEQIKNLYIGAGPLAEGNPIRLGDIAAVSRGYEVSPERVDSHNGAPSLTLGISVLSGVNIVEVGREVEKRLKAALSLLPAGIHIDPIYQQHRVVDQSVDTFMVNLVISLAIVAVSLCLFMGLPCGLAVSAVLGLTVMGTLFVMKIADIPIERISLGALVVAMGMLVDNAIVIAEGMRSRMARGEEPTMAAAQSAHQTQFPLLGATVIGILAFAGIGLSDDYTGEYTFSLFAVISIALLLSWLLALTVTPLFVFQFIKLSGSTPSDTANSKEIRVYKNMLEKVLRYRKVVLSLVIAGIGLGIGGFNFVDKAFFPRSEVKLFYINYWREQGADISATAADVLEIAKYIQTLGGVQSVSTFTGAGAERHLLAYWPELPNPAFGQLAIRVDDNEFIPDLATKATAWIAENYPSAETKIVRITVGLGTEGDIEARFSGPQSSQLRQLSQQAQEIFRRAGLINVRDDWRNKELVIEPQMAIDRAVAQGVTRGDIAEALAFSLDGRQVGLYRENEHLIPIILRAPASERAGREDLRDKRVWAKTSQQDIPMSGVVDKFELKAQDGIVRRRDGRRTITAIGDADEGDNINGRLLQIKPLVEAINLPPGYRLHWGGEDEKATVAKASLMEGLPISYLAMVVITIVLFGSVRNTVIVWLCVPMAIAGVTLAFLVFRLPFGFMALVGFLSLTGMLLKNAIVLIDEIEVQIANSDPTQRQEAVIEACASRFVPVLLTAGTTILGMAPLLFDVFFVSMAQAIMAGLAVASVLTLVVIPVLYTLVYKISHPQSS